MGRPTNSSFSLIMEKARALGIPVILDGAVGTVLDDRGVDTSSPLWSGLAPLTHAALLEAIHKEHVESGADIITTCTFRTTSRAFGAAGKPDGMWREAAQAAVRIARRASNGVTVIAGSIAPLEDCFSPSLAPSGDTAYVEHSLLAAELVAARVDLLLLETFCSANEACAAAAAARDAGLAKGVPFAVSLVTGPDGQLLSGEDLGATAACLVEMGAGAVCVNCIPPRFVNRALDRLLPAVDIPVGVYANQGRGESSQGWQGDAHLSPVEYAELASGWIERGCQLVGACCGSTPAHIRALTSRLHPTPLPS